MTEQQREIHKAATLGYDLEQICEIEGVTSDVAKEAIRLGDLENANGEEETVE